MPKDDKFELEGVVTRVLPGAKFEVEVTIGEKSHTVLCTPSGRLRQNFINIIVGDHVTVDVSTYDLTRGIITWRKK